MKQSLNYRKIVISMMILLLIHAMAWAAPGVKALNIRYSNTADKVRVVLDLAASVQYTVDQASGPDRVVVTFDGIAADSIKRQININDQMVKSVKFEVQPAGRALLTVETAVPLKYKVFTLHNPERVVIDIYKATELIGEEKVADGLVYRHIWRYTQDGPLDIHLLDIDLANDGLEVRPVLSNDMILRRETTSSIAERYHALAAVNASYFDPDGELFGLFKVNWRTVTVPSSGRTAIAWSAGKPVLVGQPTYTMNIILPKGVTVAATGLNCSRGADDLIIYTPDFGLSTMTNEYGTEYVVLNNRITDIVSGGNAVIPANGFVVSAHGSQQDKLSKLQIGDVITLNETYSEPWDTYANALGAGPLLVKGGQVQVTARGERFPADISYGRAPRSGIGVTSDQHLLLAVVDGRQPGHSIGMTLTEFATLLQKQGVTDAMNLDGGGSSAMVVHNDLVNSPSDGSERPIGSAIVVLATK